MPLISGPPPIKLVFHPFQKIFIGSEIDFYFKRFQFQQVQYLADPNNILYSVFTNSADLICTDLCNIMFKYTCKIKRYELKIK